MFKNLNTGAIGVKATLTEQIDFAKRHGFAGIDFSIGEAQTLADAQSVNAVKELFAKAGVKPGSWGFPVDYRKDDQTWRAGLDALPKQAALAAELGCFRTATWILPGDNDLNFWEYFALHVNRLRPAAQILKDHGHRFGMEFIGPKTLRDQRRHLFVYTLDGMLALGAAIGTGNMGLLLDIWHLYTSHGTTDDVRKLAATDVVTVHVNDAPTGIAVDEQLDLVRTLPGETGVLDNTDFLHALREIGYDGPVTSEPFSQRIRDLPPEQAVAETAPGDGQDLVDGKLDVMSEHLMKQIALIGCAHIHTPDFIKRMLARNDVRVTAVWDHEWERAQKRAAELNAPVVADLNAVWSNTETPAVVICAETNRHEELVLAAAAAKKHMFVEKPLGLAAADAYRMAAAIEQAGVLFQTGYFMRGSPTHLFLKQQITQGNFGKITRIRHSTCHKGALEDWFTPEWLWMTDLQQAGVGAFGDLGTHSLDILMWLMGDVTRVTATLDAAIARFPNCDEFGEALIEFANGVVGTLAASWVDVAHPISLLISGTEGHAYVRNNQLYFKSSRIAGADGETPWTDLPDPWPHAFDLFLDAVTGQADVPLVTAHEAAARSAVMEAMYQAAHKHEWVCPVAT